MPEHTASSAPYLPAASLLAKGSPVGRVPRPSWAVWRRSVGLWLGLSVCIVGGVWATTTSAAEEEVKIWEFSPYEVEIWVSFDASVTASEFARRDFLSELDAELQRTYRAAWNVHLKPLPPGLASRLGRNFDGFTLEEMRADELLLVASLKSEEAKVVRTMEAALESLKEIAMTKADRAQLAAAAERLQLEASSPTGQLLAKAVVADDGLDSIIANLQSGSLACALIPRAALPQVNEAVRPLLTTLPWQTDGLFRERDKLFFLWVGMQGEQFTFQARELDCPMRLMGPAFADATAAWPYAPRIAAGVLTRAFAPVARVEEAESRSAELTLRAGGLIVDRDNPANVQVGDVLVPVIRRDDRNGVPTLLEPLQWTFAAITASDGVKLAANVYTYSGGPGLQGRQNRRTERVVLKVRPQFASTDIQVVVRGEGRPQAGCAIYRRDLLTEEFELLGRTDWRGRFTIPVPAEPVGFIPEAVRVERFLAKKKAEAEAAKQASSPATAATTDAAADAPPAEASAEQPASSAPAESVAAETTDDPDVLTLRAPLTQIYVKSGDTVLAKLPMVPGLSLVETAELPDDARRLTAEAFVKGFQGKILDLIGLRNVLAARIQLHIKNGKLEEARQSLEELRRLRNYNDMADELEAIQRRMLNETAGPISAVAKNRIDRMFQITRDMLQKYLQDNLVSESEQAIKTASQ